MKTLFRWSRLVVSFCILLSDWFFFLAVDWLTMEHISILLTPDYRLSRCHRLDPDTVHNTCVNTYNTYSRPAFTMPSSNIVDTILWYTVTHSISKKPECQWRLCHYIYSWNAGAKEVTLFWLVDGYWILSSHRFNFQWCDWLDTFNPFLSIQKATLHLSRLVTGCAITMVTV